MTGKQFATGDSVTVRRMFPLGHIRTPRYIMGQTGVISRAVAEFPNPEELAYGRKGLPKKMLYRVRFRQGDIWPASGSGKAISGQTMPEMQATRLRSRFTIIG